MNKQTQIIYVPTADLTLYKAAFMPPCIDEDSPEFYALADDINERGFDPRYPLVCLGTRVVEGRARYRAAKRYSVKEVPTVQCCEDEIATIVLRSLIGRRHLTKSAIAYCAWPVMEPAWKELKKRKSQYLSSPTGTNTLQAS